MFNVSQNEPKMFMNEYTTEQESFMYNSDDLNNDGFFPPSDDSCDVETIKRENKSDDLKEATEETRNDRKVKRKRKTVYKRSKCSFSKEEVTKFLEERGLSKLPSSKLLSAAKVKNSIISASADFQVVV